MQRWLVSHRADRLKDAGIEGVLNRVLETGELDEDKREDIYYLLNCCNEKIENDPEAFKRARKEVTGTPYNQHCHWKSVHVLAQTNEDIQQSTYSYKLSLSFIS